MWLGERRGGRLRDVICAESPVIIYEKFKDHLPFIRATYNMRLYQERYRADVVENGAASPS
jgi:hypothetical protein